MGLFDDSPHSSYYMKHISLFAASLYRMSKNKLSEVHLSQYAIEIALKRVKYVKE